MYIPITYGVTLPQVLAVLRVGLSGRIHVARDVCGYSMADIHLGTIRLLQNPLIRAITRILDYECLGLSLGRRSCTFGAI